MYLEPSQKSKMKVFSIVSNLSKFLVITLNIPRKQSKHLLLLKCSRQKINAKLFMLLVQLMMIHTFSFKLHFPKSGIEESRNILSINKLSGDTICNSLISPQVFLGACTIQGCLDILHYIREQRTMKYC